MVTKEQLLALPLGSELHYMDNSRECCCKRIVGPRGGIKERIVRYRTSGKCRTWKRDAERFEQPVKYGLHINATINEWTAQFFHLAKDCPLND